MHALGCQFIRCTTLQFNPALIYVGVVNIFPHYTVQYNWTEPQIYNNETESAPLYTVSPKPDYNELCKCTIFKTQMYLDHIGCGCTAMNWSFRGDSLLLSPTKMLIKFPIVWFKRINHILYVILMEYHKAHNDNANVLMFSKYNVYNVHHLSLAC